MGGYGGLPLGDPRHLGCVQVETPRKGQLERGLELRRACAAEALEVVVSQRDFKVGTG